MLKDNNIPFTIPNNENTSEARDITDFMMGSLEMPSLWTAANIIFLASHTPDGTFNPLYSDSGAKAVAQVGASREVGLEINAMVLASQKWIKLKSVSSADNETAVNQVGTAAVRTYPIATNAVAGDTVTINGVTFTASADTQDETHFVVGADAAATATNLKTALNANATISALFTATDDSGTVTLTEKVTGGLNTPTAATVEGTIVIGDGTVTESVSGARTINMSVKR